MALQARLRDKFSRCEQLIHPKGKLLSDPERRARKAFFAVCAASLLCTALGKLACADPKSALFQPDLFGTDSALQKRTQGMTDPFGRTCLLPAGALTLSAAIDIALCKNPATRSAWAAAHQQAAALGVAESAWLPGISATGSVTRTFGTHQDDSGAVTSADQTTKDAAINLSWTLYDFGGREGRIRNAKYQLDTAAATASSVSQQTIVNVARDYYGVVAADAGLVAAQTTETTAAHSLEVARALRGGGVATLADVLQAETAYEQAVLSRIQANQTVKSSRGGLAVLLGSAAEQPIKLAADPVPAQAPALTARMEDLMAEAARQRPDLAAARAEVDAAVAGVAVARAAGRPSISVTAGRTAINQTGIPTQNYGQVGVNITVPIFTGFSVGYGVRQAQAALESQEVNAEQIRLNVSLDVWNAYYALDSANQQLAATATLVATASNNQDVALGRYQAGVGTILDLLTAQTAAASARQLRIAAELNWQVARAQLALALGRLSGAQPLSPDATLP
jgi:outer membrane protein